MRALIAGAAGLVGSALRRYAPSAVDVVPLDYAELDITDASAVERAVARYRPDVVINAAGYLAVDKAESDRGTVTRVNADGPAHLARAVVRSSARMLQLSTNYVFSGSSSVPYLPDDPAEPVNLYGVTKRAGELAVLNTLAERAAVVRTSWVYGPTGNSFMRTILKLLKERGTVSVVDDQLATPTSAQSLAHMLWQVARDPNVSGVHHWTDAGVASWYDFAVAIAEEAIALDLLPSSVRVVAVATAEYPTIARRPAYGVLAKRATIAALGASPAHWRVNLRAVMPEVVIE